MPTTPSSEPADRSYLDRAVEILAEIDPRTLSTTDRIAWATAAAAAEAAWIHTQAAQRAGWLRWR